MCLAPADETTHFVCAPDEQQQQHQRQTVISDMQTQPVSSHGCTRDVPGRADGDDDVEFANGAHEEKVTAAAHQAALRHEALVEGHRPVYDPDDVPKGFIAVRDQLYRKIEVKGKGGGGKVYKVCHKDDESSIWAIKKIKLGESGSLLCREGERDGRIVFLCYISILLS